MKKLSLLPILYFFINLFCFPGDLVAATPAPTYTPSIVSISEESAIETLESEGVKILRRRGNLLLCYIPVKKTTVDSKSAQRKAARNIRNIPGIDRIEHGRMLIPTMDLAKKQFGADRIHSGEGLPAAYTGKDVVVGFCDTGFDISHINFQDKAGASRVKRLVHYDEFYGGRSLMEDEKEYRNWKTDDPLGMHATHVGGIMAGSYIRSGYSGMAPDADIVATVSSLSEVGLLAGAEDIIEYAQSVGKPAVINMSVSSYTGPHDGTSLFCRYLDLIGDEAIICMAAGNEGNHANTMPFDFTEDKRIASVRLSSYSWTQFDMYGAVDIWSRDMTPFKARFCIYDEYDKKILFRSETIDFSETDHWRIDSATDGNFAKFYSGAVEFDADVWPENDRFYLTMSFSASTKEASPSGSWARYNLAMEIEGDPGSHADFYADGVYTFLKPISQEFGVPGSQMSISDIATSDNCISVGMYCNRVTVPYIDGGERTISGELGTVSSFSAYGTLPSGEKLPLTVAPGEGIISSWSSHDIANNTYLVLKMSAKEVVGGKTYYWGECTGTSMSTPYVAGTIATWLEANPNLTLKDIKKIIAETNIQDFPDADNPRHGQGWFNPYEGIKKAVSLSSVTGVETDSTSARIILSGKTLSVLNPAGAPLELKIYSSAGLVVKSVGVSATVNEISLDSLPSGIYIAAIPGYSIKIRI